MVAKFKNNQWVSLGDISIPAAQPIILSDLDIRYNRFDDGVWIAFRSDVNGTPGRLVVANKRKLSF